MRNIQTLDTALARPIARLPRSLKTPFHWLGLAAQPSIWALIVAVYTLWQYDGDLTTPGVAILLLIPLATVSKFLFRRERPPTIYAGNMRIKSYSFPSSHAYTAGLCCTFFAIIIAAPLVSLALFCLAGIIGTSRVYLGAHYPSDVIAGWLLGIVLASGVAVWF